MIRSTSRRSASAACAPSSRVKSKVSLNVGFKLGFDVRARDDDEGFLADEFRDFEGEDAFAEARTETEDAFTVFDDRFGDAFLVVAEFDRTFERDRRVDVEATVRSFAASTSLISIPSS